MAGGTATCLAVDRGHGVGDGLCGAATAQWRGRSGTSGGALLGLVGQRSLERLYLVSQLAATALLGPFAAGHRSHEQALWTFVRHVEAEPTNNVAERAIRPGVLWRQGSFGTHSPEGSRFVETMMTVVATLKQQHRNVLDYLTAACEAVLHGEQVPSLLPTPDQLKACLPLAA